MGRLRLLGFVFAFLLAGQFTPFAEAIAPSGAVSPWSDFGGGGSNTHLSTLPGSSQPVRLLWEFSTPGYFLNNQPVITGDGNLIFTGRTDIYSPNSKLYGVSSAGLSLWEQELNNVSISAWPALTTDNQVLIDIERNFTSSYAVRSYDATTGQQLWGKSTAPYRAGGGSGLAVDSQNNIYFASGGNVLFSYDSDGVQRWSAVGGGADRNTVVTPGGLIYALSGPVRVFDTNGQIQFNATSVNDNLSFVTVRDDGTFFASGAGGSSSLGSLYAFNAIGNYLWRRTDLKGSVSIGSSGEVYALGGGKVHSLDPSTGMDIWSTAIGPLSGNTYDEGITVDSEGVLYVADSMGVLSALSPAGNVLWTYDLAPNNNNPINPSAPVIGHGGVLYIAGGNNQVFYALVAVPEPSSYVLITIGILAFAYKTKGLADL